jgi:glycosyltransferase involved in cell wall biosynthesis
MTLLEAMSLSKPCVVTYVGGNPEVVQNGVNGLVVPSNDCEGFSEAIIELLTDVESNESMGIKGRGIFLKNFIVSQMISEYERIYI